jgi:hypothetical protein
LGSFRLLDTSLRESHSTTVLFSSTLRMAAAFHDTFFAYILRSAFGSRVFTHSDEKSLPTSWQKKRLPHVSQQSDFFHPNPEVTSLSTAVADTTVANTAVANTPDETYLEKGKDLLLVDWDGPSDPDVSCWWEMILPPLLTSHARIHRTGRVQGKLGSFSRPAF